MMDIKNLLQRPEYRFIQTDEHLGRHVILLGLSGSYSYGTNNENSDIDVRGVTLNQKSDLIGLTKFEQYTDEHTDTVIFSLNKVIGLLTECNPNTIELLGLNPEHYLYINELGQMLLDHKSLFLSKRAVQSFGGYADAQLRRLQNALARDSFAQSEREQHIFNSIKNAMYDFKERYAHFDEGSLRLYIDKAVHADLDTEIFMDANLNHYPLRDYKTLWNDMNNIVKMYDKVGKRNKKKDDNHLNKHAMHLVRLFMMVIDILEKGDIHTYRDAEHDLLLSIRNGEFRSQDGNFKDSFYKIVADYEHRLHKAAAMTKLPDVPDMQKIQKLMMTMNEKVIFDEI